MTRKSLSTPLIVAGDVPRWPESPPLSPSGDLPDQGGRLGVQADLHRGTARSAQAPELPRANPPSGNELIRRPTDLGYRHNLAFSTFDHAAEDRPVGDGWSEAMGYLKDYLTDFPTSNEANWINGRYDPRAAFEALVTTAERTYHADPPKLDQVISDLYLRATAKHSRGGSTG